MSSKKLEKKLQGDINFIPFNKDFDYNKILEYLQKIEISTIDLELSQIALSSIHFNQYFQTFRNLFLKSYKGNELNKSTYLEILITLANRDYHKVSRRAQDSFSKQEKFNYDKATNSVLKSSIPELGNINAQAGLEANHDGLNSVLNLLRQEETKYNGEVIKIELVENCFNLLSFSNIYAVIKSAYDMTVWENYRMNIGNKDKLLHITKPKNNIQEANKIGQYRLERNMFSAKQVIVASYFEKNYFYQYILEESLQKRKSKKLKKVEIREGFIEFKLADGKESDSILQENLLYAELTSYYSFIKNEKLPNLSSIKLHDIILIFSEIRYLFDQAYKTEKLELGTLETNFNAFKIKIRKANLTDYLRRKTNFSSIQIKHILQLFCHTDNYFDVWEKPIIENKGILYPVLLPLLNSNTLRLIDYWLEQGGFDLDLRGEKFEVHIKEMLEYELEKKGFNFNIPKVSNFKNSNEKFEEIDLILELKNVVMIAEIKCIKYPFDPRDFHNNYKRLKQAAEQIKRKTGFLKSNKNEFSDQFDFSKKIIQTIITNFPLFSGISINDIPIIDFSLLENYFVTGALRKGQMTIEDKKIDFSKKQNSIIYYKNEDELSDNLNNFLKNPVPVDIKMKDIFTEDTQLTINSAKPKIKMEYLKFKEENII
ncbi:hypothetical protein RM549_05595 [Salegentibacter sp. F188]|uniref:NERD domain-containing protein n=1 Tax=Autumnicola patrickiae TaxID=3075591 RepID=A0ABU3E0N8_9FLAO|nr:hypothetical protein [Salegentibacter sp. F188]MDT0689249.1 hypothetical protein [Salegentibacter sp. F188]